jgi:hypothetical protein
MAGSSTFLGKQDQTLGGGRILISNDKLSWHDFKVTADTTIASSIEEKEAFDGTRAMKTIAKVAQVSVKYVFKFTTESPYLENMKRFLVGTEIVETTQTSGTWTAESFTVVKPDQWQDLGKENITITAITDDTAVTPVPLVEGIDYEIDLERGLFMPLSSSTHGVSAVGDIFKITGTYAETVLNSIKAGENKSDIVHFKFLGEPSTGIKQDVYGYGCLKASGDLALGNYEFEKMSFEIACFNHPDYGVCGVRYIQRSIVD